MARMNRPVGRQRPEKARDEAMEPMVAQLLLRPLSARIALLVNRFERLARDLDEESAMIVESLRKHARAAQHQVAGLREWYCDATVIIGEVVERWITEQGIRHAVWTGCLEARDWLQWLARFQGYVECVLQRNGRLSLLGRLRVDAESLVVVVPEVCREASRMTRDLRAELQRFHTHLGHLLDSTEPDR